MLLKYFYLGFKLDKNKFINEHDASDVKKIDLVYALSSELCYMANKYGSTICTSFYK
jgi:hypothetical protein